MQDWDGRYHELDYDSAVAIRYHGRRKAFLDKVSRADPALSIVFGGAAFATVLTGHPHLAAAAGLMVAATSACNLAFGLSDKTRLHERLFQEWSMLRGDLALLKEDDEQALRLLEVKRAKLDGESPWQLLTLSTLCENEEKAVRRESGPCPVGTLPRMFANWFDFPGWTPAPPKDQPDAVSAATPALLT